MNRISFLLFGALLVAGCGEQTNTVYKRTHTVTVTKTIVNNNVATEEVPSSCQDTGGSNNNAYSTLAMSPAELETGVRDSGVQKVTEVLILCNGKIYRVKVN